MTQISVTLAVTASQLAQIAAIMGGETAAPKTEPAAPRSRSKTEDTETKSKETEVKGKDKAGDDVPEVPSAEDVTAAAQRLNKANGREALVEMLGKFDAKNVSGIAEERRQDFIDAVDKAVG